MRDHGIPTRDDLVLRFMPGETTHTIEVTIVDDAVHEPAEAFAITLSNATNASISDSTATGTITDDDIMVPGSPSIGAATPGSASVTISFSPPASDGGAPITAYTVTCTSQNGQATASGTASPLIVNNLTIGVTYQCSVTATNIAGTGPASAAVSAMATPQGAGAADVPVGGMPLFAAIAILLAAVAWARLR